MRTVNAGTPNTRETIASILMRNAGMKLSAAEIDKVVNQLMYLVPDLPTLEQMQELINLAYGLGWKDRAHAIWNTTPPTVTVLPNQADGSWTFLYDGKPRP